MRPKPLIELSEKEFLKFFKFGLGTGGQLTYRIRWLQDKVKELGLKIDIRKNDGKYICSIHKEYLNGRQVQNPLYKSGSFIEGRNCLFDKDKFDENESDVVNIDKLQNKRGYIQYYFNSDIKTFIFSLIKKYYNDRKENKHIH